MDRLLFARLPAEHRPSDVTATQFRRSVIADRLRRFWRGQWQQLWDEVRLFSQATNFNEDELDGGRSVKRKVARVAALLAAG
eukprot:842659-Alexandrium_andersonii.AAC.1